MNQVIQFINLKMVEERVKEAVQHYMDYGTAPPQTEEEFKAMMLTVMDEKEYARADRLYTGEESFERMSFWAQENDIKKWAGDGAFLPFFVGA